MLLIAVWALLASHFDISKVLRQSFFRYSDLCMAQAASFTRELYQERKRHCEGLETSFRAQKGPRRCKSVPLQRSYSTSEVLGKKDCICPAVILKYGECSERSWSFASCEGGACGKYTTNFSSLSAKRSLLSPFCAKHYSHLCLAL